MAVKEWTTNLPAAQDTGTDGEDQMPTLVDGSDDTRVSQIHALRKKANYNSVTIGDESELPAGCLRARMTTAESGLTHAIRDDEAGEIHAVAEKVAPADADEILIEDSAASYAKKRVQLANLPGVGLSDRYPVFQDVKGSATTASFSAYVALHSWETVKDSDNPPDQWYIALTVRVVQVYSETMDVKVTIGSDVREWLGLSYTTPTLIFDKIAVGADPTDTLLACKIEARVSASGASAYVERVDIAAIWT